jgi:ParB family chromosome partitioning protein
MMPMARERSSGGYEVIAGERRLRAARALNLDEVPVFIKKASDQEAFVLALVENIQREELNPIEEAVAFKRLVEEFTLSQEDLAKAVGKDRTTISNTLRLLKLPQEIQAAVMSGELSMGHARALVAIQNPAEQKTLFQQVLERGMSVREVENFVKTETQNPLRKKRKTPERSHELVFIEEDLQQTLGTKVRILPRKKRGKIVIEYYSPDDLERIIAIIKS